MKYLLFFFMLAAGACNTSSNEKPRETDSARVDGTRTTDTTIASDSVPPGIQNPQPD